MTKTEFIEKLAEIELAEANIIHEEKFNSWHEAYAVLKEEIEETQDEIARVVKLADELWYAIKKDNLENAVHYTKAIKITTRVAIQEAVQVVAMCKKILESEE